MAKGRNRFESFASLVGAVVRQLNTGGRLEQTVVKAAQAEAKKVPVWVKRFTQNWVVKAILRDDLDFETAFLAVSKIFGKGIAERKIRVPLLIHEEQVVQTSRRQGDQDLASHLPDPNEMVDRLKTILQKRRTWFYQIGDSKDVLDQIQNVLEETSRLHAEIDEYNSVIAVFDCEIQAIKTNVNSRFDFTADELRSLVTKVREIQATKTELHKEAKLESKRLRLKEVNSWLKSMELLLADEVGMALEGLIQLNGTCDGLTRDLVYQGSEASMADARLVNVEAKNQIAAWFNDAADVEPNRIKAKFLRNLASEAEGRA